MTRFSQLLQSAVNPALISVHPVFAAEIAEGRKRVEFRRRWSNTTTDVLVIYATAPTKAIVAIVAVKEVRRVSTSQLWELSKSLGGSLSRERLRVYMQGLDRGVALLLGKSFIPHSAIAPKAIFGDSFVAPQSFRYLRPDEVKALVACLASEE